MQNYDEKYLRKCLKLAKRTEGQTSPNPLVGCIIVNNGKVISSGYHKFAGAPHAEREAIDKVKDKDNLKGATLYVNLEPCCHLGRTPPCVDKIIESKISKVVIGIPDPNPLVGGKSIDILKKQGVKVEVGILEDKCRKLNEIFMKFISTGLPFVAVKSAVSLDGKIATYNFQSKWITDEYSREYSHKIRLKYDAILVGINTVLRDNPHLTVRKKEKVIKVPYKIVLDSCLKIPLNCNILKDHPEKTIIATLNKKDKDKIRQLTKNQVKIIFAKEKNKKIDIADLMKKLGKENITSVLIEGGGEVNFSAFASKIVDKLYFFYAPKIIGGKNAPTACDGDGIKKISDAIKIKTYMIKKLKEDFLLEAYL